MPHPEALTNAQLLGTCVEEAAIDARLALESIGSTGFVDPQGDAAKMAEHLKQAQSTLNGSKPSNLVENVRLCQRAVQDSIDLPAPRSGEPIVSWLKQQITDVRQYRKLWPDIIRDAHMASLLLELANVAGRGILDSTDASVSTTDGVILPAVARMQDKFNHTAHHALVAMMQNGGTDECTVQISGCLQEMAEDTGDIERGVSSYVSNVDESSTQLREFAGRKDPRLAAGAVALSGVKSDMALALGCIRTLTEYGRANLPPLADKIHAELATCNDLHVSAQALLESAVAIVPDATSRYENMASTLGAAAKSRASAAEKLGRIISTASVFQQILGDHAAHLAG